MTKTDNHKIFIWFGSIDFSLQYNIENKMFVHFVNINTLHIDQNFVFIYAVRNMRSV